MDQIITKESPFLNKLKEDFIFSHFKEASLEKLYQKFTIRQKRKGLECFLVTSILFDLYMIFVPNKNDEDMATRIVMTTFLILNVSLLVWCKKRRRF